ncbi:MAG: hypothetical protein R3C10_12710 [Pirellulales bacterium]|nr:hypothetical protein [Planctomycetales bacterium]
MEEQTFASELVEIFLITLVAGVLGSVVAGVSGYFGRDSSIKLETSTGVGFLVGAAFGATFAIFRSMMH